MKVKNLKVFLFSALAFVMIGTFRSCQEYKIKQESKIGNITKKAQEIKFEDIFISSTERNEQELKIRK